LQVGIKTGQKTELTLGGAECVDIALMDSFSQLTFLARSAECVDIALMDRSGQVTFLARSL